MDIEVELDGTRYIYIGGEWFGAQTFIKPPDVVIQRLNQYLPAQARKPVAHSVGRPADDSTFSHAEVFPIIADIIRATYQHTQAFVTHEEITNGLLEHPAGRELVDAASQRQGEEKPLAAVAANMVAWFSQRITAQTSDYQALFDRQKIDGRWAYRPRPD